MKEFPKALLYEFMAIKEANGYKLTESEGLNYAFYEKEVDFGFKHGIRFDKMAVGDTEKILYRLQTLSGNNWGKGIYLIVNEEYFLNLEDAIGKVNEKQRVYKPKRKPERIRAMTQEQIEAFIKA